MALDEVRRLLGGKWKLDRSENFEDVLKEMGLNILFRKLAATTKPSMEILVEGDTVKINAKAVFYTHELSFKLNEEYEQEYDGIQMKCFSKWEDGKLITEAEPIDPQKSKRQKFHRERVNDELVQTMWVGDVVCTRIFKRQS